MVRRQIRLNRNQEIEDLLQASMTELVGNARTPLYYRGTNIGHLAFAFPVASFVLRWGTNDPNAMILLMKAAKVSAWQPSKSTPGDNQVRLQPLSELVNNLVKSRKTLSYSEMVEGFKANVIRSPQQIVAIFDLTLEEELFGWMAFVEGLNPGCFPKESRKKRFEALARSLAVKFGTSFNCEAKLSPAPPVT